MEHSDSFFKRVYEQVKKIERGKVSTYGRIAKSLGNPKMSRQVGWALHVNPDPKTIPCHRVVDRNGRLSEAFAFGGINRQAELLFAEGVVFNDDGTVNLKLCLFERENC